MSKSKPKPEPPASPVPPVPPVVDAPPRPPQAPPAERRASRDDELTTVEQLRPDDANRRRHTPRNLDMIGAALRDVGAARSIVIDETNEVLAGNGVLDAAPGAGISKVRIVDVDGDTIIAVRRSGLTVEQKRALAIYDNRAAELAEWNLEQLGADAANGLDFAPFFTDAELGALLGPVAPSDFKSVDITISTTYCCPSCGYQWAGNPKPASAAAETAAAAAPAP